MSTTTTSTSTSTSTTTTTTPRTWLITGTSTGIGHALALYALSQGDHVLAASRNPTNNNNTTLASAGAICVNLDPSSASPQTVQHQTTAALANFSGHCDIVVLNAGYVLAGTLEDRTPAELLAQYQCNVFGPLQILSAVLPGMRTRRRGVVAMVGSMGSHLHSPAVGVYHSSKAALRSLSLTLREELGPLGVRVCCVEPGHFRTPVLGGVGVPETRVEEYRAVNEGLGERFGFYHGRQLGSVQKGVEVMFEVLTQTGVGQGREVPGALMLGSDAVETVLEECERVRREVEEWREVSVSTDYPEEERFY